MNKKCDICKKHRPIILKCRCGCNYCLKHRYIENHNCKFDYKNFEREKIRKENPIIVKDKITKI